MAPQVGVGAGTPTPRKLRIDSTRMTTPTVSVAMTITVEKTPGSMCVYMIRTGDDPATFAKAT